MLKNFENIFLILDWVKKKKNTLPGVKWKIWKTLSNTKK